MSLLGIDIGSGSCKGVVFDMSGSPIASATRVYPTGFSETEKDATVFRDAVFDIIRTLAPEVQQDVIDAIGISSHGETIIPVDQNGNAMAAAIMNSDNRAVTECASIERTLTREFIYSVTGLPAHPMFGLNKILWLKKNRPDLYTHTHQFLSVADYILVQLGLPPYTDYSLASRVMAFDIRTHEWSSDILAHCNIAYTKLATPVAAGTPAGTISKSIAASLGLKEDVIVTVAGHDQPCGAFGAGAINAGSVYDSAGSYECLSVVSDEPLIAEKALPYSLNSYCHVVPDKYVTLAFFPAGVVTSWFYENFCFEEKQKAQQTGLDFFEILNSETITTVPGASGICMTPHFVGACNPYWDTRATGVIAGITPSIGRFHLHKAIHEGIACELALNCSVLDDVLQPIDEIVISGGNARTAFALQLRADITRKNFRLLAHHEAVCMGAAMLAGIASGIFINHADAVSRMVRVASTISPDPISQSNYLEQYRRYSLLYPLLEKFRASNS